MQRLELPPNMAFVNDDHYPDLSERKNEVVPELVYSQQIQRFEGCIAQNDVPCLEADALESFNEITALSRVYKRVQAFEADALTTTSTTRSRGWSALSGISSARVSTIGVIALPLRQSELDGIRDIGSFQMSLNYVNQARDDLQTVWIYLQETLNKLMPLEQNLDMKTWMRFYTKVHNFCTSGASTTISHAGSNNARCVHLPSERLYILLNMFLSGYLKQKTAIAETYTGEALLSFYVLEWKKYIKAAEFINCLFRYLNRHWVRVQRHEGRKDVYDIYTLHLVRWNLDFWEEVRSRIIVALLQSIKRSRDGQIVEQLLITATIDSWGFPRLDEEDCASSILDVYKRDFEQPFLHATKEYYQQISKHLIAENSVTEYMKKAELRLEDESHRVGLFLRPETVEILMNVCNRTLITDHIVLLQADFQPLLDKERKEDLTRMYKLLCRTKKDLGPLKDKFDAYLQKDDLGQCGNVRLG